MYFSVLFLAFSCSTIKELPSPQEEAPSLTETTDLTTLAINEHGSKVIDGNLAIDFQLSDSSGMTFRLDDSNVHMISVERKTNEKWEVIPAEHYQVQPSSVKYCPPIDYCIILDQSGSMQDVQTLIFREVDQFIDYKNDFDHLALIKYANAAKVVNGYLANKKEIRSGLFRIDSLGAGTNTPNAFQLFLDSLSADHPSAKIRLILFSDISGNTSSKLAPLMQAAYAKGIQTDRVIYSKWIKKRRFTKEGKKRFYDLIHSNYGRTYVINSLGSISSCLKDFMNDECLASRVLIPVDSVGKHEYRLSLRNESSKQELVIEYLVEQLPDTSVLQTNFSLDTLNLIHIEFATGSDKILEASYTELNKVYEFLQHYPHVMIQLQGHTDNQGSYAYNMDLSARRAKSAMNYLIEKGIKPGRMRAEGYGYTRPIDSNDTSEGRQRNRRTEFVVIQQED